MFLKSPPALVLASTSVYRRELLGRVQIPFICDPPGVDEAAIPGEDPFKSAKPRIVRAGEPEFKVTSDLFDSLD